MLNHYRELIESALAYSGGTHSFEDVVAMVTSGKAQIWPGKASVGITEIIEYPRKRVLHVFLAAGDMDELLVMMDYAKRWGREQGCESVTMSGRMGWQRVLDKHGWTPVLVTMQAPL